MPDSSPQEIVRVSSDVLYGSCHECRTAFTQVPQLSDFEVKVNHYIQEHGYLVLHVGQEMLESLPHLRM